MKTTVFIVFFSFFLAWSVQAQFNYIPNGDFEEYTECPGFGLIEFMIPWYDPNSGTCDAYNQCSTNQDGVPQNFFGYQEAQSGKGYAGFSMLDFYLSENLDTIFNTEYLTTELNKSLIKNEVYCLSFAITRADSACLSFSEMQVFLSKEKIKNNSSDVNSKLLRPYQLEFNILDVNDENWIVLEQTFKAKGDERYISFGNFKNSYKFQKKDGGNGSGWENLNYYYVDNIKLFKLNESTCTYISPKVNIPNVFTPNGDEFNDVFFVTGLSGTLTIINRWGQTLFEGDAETGWDGTITSNGKKAVDGVYFYLFMDEEGNQQQGYLHLVGNE